MIEKFKGIKYYINRFNDFADEGVIEISFIDEMVKHIAELEHDPIKMEINGVGVGIGEGAEPKALKRFPEGFVNTLKKSQYHELPADIAGKGVKEIKEGLSEFFNRVNTMFYEYNDRHNIKDKGQFLYEEGQLLAAQYLIYGDLYEEE